MAARDIYLSVIDSINPREDVPGGGLKPAAAPLNADCVIINKGVYDYPGYEKTLEGGLGFSLEEGLPLVTLGHDEVITRNTHQHIWRDLCAQIFDFNLWCLSRADAVLDLLIGDILAELRDGRLNRLGYVRIGDFSREFLGISKSRAYELINRALALKKLQLLREAYENGHVNSSNLREILKVVTEETQVWWIEKAKRLTVRELQDEVKKAPGQNADPVETRFTGSDDGWTAGGGYDDSLRRGISVSVNLPLRLAARWDYALSLFRKMEEGEIPVTLFLEALLAEYASSSPDNGGDMCGETRDSIAAVDESGVPLLLENSARTGEARVENTEDLEKRKLREMYRETMKAFEEMSEYWSFLPWKPVVIAVPDSLKGDPSCGGDPFLMAQKLRRIVRLQHAVAFYEGIMLHNINNRNLYRDMMFTSLGHYVSERFGMSQGTAYGRIRMLKIFLEYPEIKDRFLQGEFSQEQARLLVRVYREGAGSMNDWIDYARRAPALKLSQKVEEFIVKRDTYERTARLRRQKRQEEESRGQGQICVCEGSAEDMPADFEAAMLMHRAGGAAEELSQEAGSREFEMCGMTTGQDQPARETAAVKFFIPRSLCPVWDAAARIYAAQCRRAGEEPALTGFIESLIEHFLEVWETPEKRTFHDQVLKRDGFVCQIPGCGCRRNLEAHHIIYRSRGGADKLSNGITLCAAHHRACVHTGSIVISGEAPDNITIVIGRAGEVLPPVVFRNGVRVLSDCGKRKAA